ncbi:DUF3379 family protein [Thalassotalea euphylliae]|uniref:DUF3379 family protein n=1 Tax=Thalassotalea euphylliae TaxID=1655234 RepID=UPI00364163C1
MDDLQFRRSLYADPKSKDPELADAKNADASRQQFAKELEQLDEKIASALDIPVPEDLSNKLILRQAMASHRQDKRKTRIHLALAASVAFVGGLTLNFLQFSSAYNSLGDYALAHVYHEEGVFSNADVNRVSMTTLNTKMAAFNGSFTGAIGELISADYCRFDGVKSLHLVFKGANSPVNVFIVPERDGVAFSEQFSDSLYKGQSINAGSNQVIVVGDKSEQLNKWQENLSKNVRWST